MAAKGNYAAFKRLKPTDGLSSDIQKQQQFGFKRRQEDRIEEGIEYQRAQAKKKSDRAFYDKHIKPLNNFDTGSKTANEANARLLAKARDEMGRLAQIKDNAEPGSDEYIKATTGLQSIYNLPDKIKTLYSGRMSQYQQAVKAAEQGKIHKDENYEKFVKNYQGQMEDVQLGFDDQYDVAAAFLDEEGNVQDTDSYSSYVNGKLPFEPTPVFNFEKTAQGVADAVGKIKDTDLPDKNGVVSFTNTAKMKPINNSADRLFSMDENGNFKESTKSAFIQAGYKRSEWNEKNMEKLKNAYIDDVRGRIDEEYKDTKASKSKQSSNNSSDNNVKIKQAVTPSKETWGEKVNLIADEAKSVGVSGVEIPALRDIDSSGDKQFITDAKVRNYTYTGDGKMMVDVVYQDVKSSTFESEEEGFFEKLIKSRNDAKDNLEEARQNGDEDQVEYFRGKYAEANLKLKRLKQGGQNVRKTVVIPKEDEADVASYLGGIDNARAKAFSKPQEKETEGNNSNIQTTMSGGTAR